MDIFATRSLCCACLLFAPAVLELDARIAGAGGGSTLLAKAGFPEGNRPAVGAAAAPACTHVYKHITIKSGNGA